ncbi:MAG TPA: AMP-binding protein [Planctomycetota bacterium]
MSTTIRKKQGPEPPPPVLLDYAATRAAFSWEEVAGQLVAPLAGPLNVGELAVRRGGTLLWYGSEGQVERFTSDELVARSGRAARAFASLGVKTGDRVAFMCKGIPELAFGVLGALRLGAVPLVLGRAKTPEPVRAFLLKSGARVLVCEPDVRPLVEAAAAPGPLPLETIVLVARGGTRMAGPSKDVAWDELVPAQSPDFDAVPLPPEAPAWMHPIDTLTGPAVAAHHSAFPLFSSAGLALDLRPGDGFLALALPGDTLFVPYGLLAPLLRGAKTFLFEDPVRFNRYGNLEDPVHVWLSAGRGLDVVLHLDPGLGLLLSKCRHIAVAHPYDLDFTALTRFSYGSPLHPVWIPRELGSIQAAEFRAFDIMVGSVGRALPGSEIKIDEASGCLAVRLGPSVPFTGYWEDVGTQEKRVKNGWFITDLPAKMDPDGYAWIAS